MNEILKSILLEKRLIFISDPKKEADEKKRAYLNSFLYINFGIVLDNPEEITDNVLRAIDGLLYLNVPSSFYESPQDTKYFSCGELFVEQVVSYWLGYGTNMKRIELIEKELPRKNISTEMKVRHYRIIFKEEAEKVLKETLNNYLSYKRPFNEEEKVRFLALDEEGYFSPEMEICCRDNIFPMLLKYPSLASRLDKKDIAKFSLLTFGDNPDFRFNSTNKAHVEGLQIIKNAIPYVKDCPLSKRQAKIFNRAKKAATGVKGHETNVDSVYAEMERRLKSEGPCKTAKYLSDKGSLLERNLRYLLSRCENSKEIRYILNLVPNKNPVVLAQIYYSLAEDKPNVSRTFLYRKNRMNCSYRESEEEAQYRKSNLNETQRELVLSELKSLIRRHYFELPRIGNIYVSEQFKRVAVPFTTEATGRGVDVLPSGSRIKFDGNFIRIFCHWDGPYDIDASLACLKKDYFDSLDEDFDLLSWQTYSLKPFGHAALFSGDDTSNHGTEFQDADIQGLLDLDFRYLISGINGYRDDFSVGTIIQGLQIKNEINTKPWDPKNIEFQLNVKANARAFTGFAVDLESKEIVVINAISEGGQLFRQKQMLLCKRYLSKHYLDINMYDILRCSGYLVATPEEADIVFDAEYSNPDKKVIRPFDVDSLIAIVNR
ncbi:MAG: hypothetical protein II721_03760 [Bacilli bacterium]|nr:hypothetical protein [Bacilli bacterium]